MNRAIVTISCGDFYRRMAAISHPTIKAYADKLGADFIVWDDYDGHTMPHYQKLELGKLLRQYERVLYIDTDILVRDDAPDIFAARAGGLAGSARRRPVLPRSQGVDDALHADRSVTSLATGTVDTTTPACWCLSQAHRDLFVQPPVEVDNFREQTYLNLLFALQRHEDLRIAVSLQPRVLHGRFLRRAAFRFLYHALCRHQLAVARKRTARIDAEATLRSGRSTSRHMRFARALRWSSTAVWPSRSPRNPRCATRARCCTRPIDSSSSPVGRKCYSHLKAPVYLELDQIPERGSFLVQIIGQRQPEWEPATQRLSAEHVVDVAARRLLGRELPEDAKTPRLRVDEKAMILAAGQVANPTRPSISCCCIPAAVAKATRFRPTSGETMPTYFASNGIRVAIIGERKADFAVVDFDTAGCLNLVGKLSLPETIALVSKARVLVANDSAATAIAGAFEGWIGLIAPARRPEHVLHHRHGSPLWRTKVLERAARYLSPEAPLATSTADREANLREALPTPEQVLEFVRFALAERGG